MYICLYSFIVWNQLWSISNQLYFYSDIDISKEQLPKKIATVAKEATILDHEVNCNLGWIVVQNWLSHF